MIISSCIDRLTRSEWLLVDPVEDGVIGWLTLELGSHVTSSVDCNECQAIALLDVTGDLLTIDIGDIVWSPGLLDLPGELIDPLLGTVCWHGTIGVTGVLEDPVAALKQGIDPLGSILGGSVVKFGCSAAEIPLFSLLGDVEGGLDGVVVKVVNNRLGVDAGWHYLEHGVLGSSQERSVLSSGHTSLRNIRDLFVFGFEVGFHSGGVLPALTEDVVDINKGDKVVELVHPSSALLREWRRVG